jgi:acyl-coenzyme A synthetase/AMP-(fatty) acid ligase
MGRTDDLIASSRKEYHRIDIELYIRHSTPGLEHEATIIFSLTLNKIIVLQEVPDLVTEQQKNKIASILRKNVLKKFNILITAIVLVKSGSLPRTMSGKLKRNSAKNAYLSKSLDILYENNDYCLGDHMKNFYFK